MDLQKTFMASKLFHTNSGIAGGLYSIGPAMKWGPMGPAEKYDNRNKVLSELSLQYYSKTRAVRTRYLSLYLEWLWEVKWN
jgi:hypothetical protein